ncbi:HAMP domain-containing sensor histidine kinase [Actinomadura sp. 7K507]|uniref:sensor histidine kinase n=1 Tax=Actinomadura sp. 7K507 TaxID=2530365 RepID=UPI0010528815|nr:HAMP domain-containing sensor histidine kinase [Actinomadura sp. 7K507]TDC86069.1 hypothetical protein E1285_24070 [Actinomadura sp. 7K507]
MFRERHWNVVNAPITDSDGNIVAIIHKVQEITPFLDQLRRAAAPSAAPDSAAVQMQQIEVELLDRARELNEVNKRLHQAQALERQTSQELRRQMRRHRDAVADTSHDLKGPISGLQTRLQGALADPDTDLRDMLLAALQDAERLDDIVSELLVLAQLESDSTPDHQPVDLAHLVETELARRPQGITITTRLQPDTAVEGSPVQLAGCWRTWSATPNATPTPASRSRSPPTTAARSWRSPTTGPAFPPPTAGRCSAASIAVPTPAAKTPTAPGSACPSPGRSPTPTKAASTSTTTILEPA